MPRRNRRPKATNPSLRGGTYGPPPSELPEPERLDAYAVDLVRRGLASKLILDRHGVRNNKPDLSPQATGGMTSLARRRADNSPLSCSHIWGLREPDFAAQEARNA